MLYGAIYWLTKLKGERCTASNSTLGDLCGIKEGASIRHSLLRLEKNGYIRREFSDQDRKIRDEIIPLVTYDRSIGVGLDEPTLTLEVGPNGPTRVGPNGPQKKKLIKEELTLSRDRIFEAWNQESIIHHSTLRKDMEKAIDKSLKDYTEEEIIRLITLYSSILKDDSCYWTKKWNLVEFLSRGLKRFDGMSKKDFMKSGTVVNSGPSIWDLASKSKLFETNGKD
jgi:hypothetical protein